MINRTLNRTITYILACFFLLTLVAMFILYANIFAKIEQATHLGLATSKHSEKATKKQPDTEKIDESDTFLKTNRNKDKSFKIASRLSKGLFVSFAITAVSIVPGFIVSVVDFDSTFPSYFHLYPWLAFRLCAAINPIIYPVFHSSFWQAYMNVYEHVVH